MNSKEHTRILTASSKQELFAKMTGIAHKFVIITDQHLE